MPKLDIERLIVGSQHNLFKKLPLLRPTQNQPVISQKMILGQGIGLNDKKITEILFHR